MRLWRCPNCGVTYDAPRPQNRCWVCGMHLTLELYCDKPSCGKQVTAPIHAEGGRILCPDHLSEVLEISIALGAPA